MNAGKEREALSACVKLIWFRFLATLSFDQALGADQRDEQSCNAQYFIA